MKRVNQKMSFKVFNQQAHSHLHLMSMESKSSLLNQARFSAKMASAMLSSVQMAIAINPAHLFKILSIYRNQLFEFCKIVQFLVKYSFIKFIHLY